MIYLDNAATTLHKPEQVADAVTKALSCMGNASRGAHDEAINAALTIYETRMKLAALFGCPKAEYVIFTQNSTEALNIAINGLIHPGCHVITTDLEHNSVLRPLYRLEETEGVKLSFMPADKKGCIDYNDLERLITHNTFAIICTHASNLTGNMLDISLIGKFAHEHNLLFIVDASQSAGCQPINMQEMNIDVLCFTGHKGLMGPQGTGGICLRDSLDIKHWKVGGSGIQSYSKTHPTDYPARLEAGTLNGHGIAGLGAALDFIQSTGIETIRKKEHALMQRFYDGISILNGVTVYGDFSQNERAAIVALNIHDYDSALISDELSQTYKIATRSGAHCAPRMHDALGTSDRGAVRFSFSYFNTEEEVDAAILAVKELSS